METPIESADRNGLGRALHKACPIVLDPGTPWEALRGREREVWCLLADVALRWCQPTPGHASERFLEELREQSRDAWGGDMTRLYALAAYAQHLQSCAKMPCTCGLTALLAEMPV